MTASSYVPGWSASARSPAAQTTVRRTRDAGLDKSLAYLILVPFIGIFIALVLLLKGPYPKTRANAATDYFSGPPPTRDPDSPSEMFFKD